jgi:hypothetical protein
MSGILFRFLSRKYYFEENGDLPKLPNIAHKFISNRAGIHIVNWLPSNYNEQ